MRRFALTAAIALLTCISQLQAHGDLYNVEYDYDKGSEGLLTHAWSYWQGEEFKLKTVKPADGSKISMLGVPGDLKWRWSEADGLIITYPHHKARPTSCSYAWSFKIKIK